MAVTSASMKERYARYIMQSKEFLIWRGAQNTNWDYNLSAPDYGMINQFLKENRYD